MSDRYPKGHWRRTTFYVGYLCPHCHTYIHHNLGYYHQDDCWRESAGPEVAYHA